MFFVVAEGERTEYDYIGFLNSEYGAEYRFRIDVPRLAIRRNGLKPVEVVEESVRAVMAGDFDEVWALFDRDQHPGIPQAIRRARETGVQVAFSNPAFDLWLLLHFDDVPADWRGSNKDVITKLRRFPDYRDYGRDNKAITAARAQRLVDRQAEAIKRARALIDNCATGSCSSASGHSEHCSPLNRCPSTDVWRLLVALMAV